ncbi:MAG: Lrp/AsnC family transcriptional regulator [Crocinitomicaceae bacterium]|nr:Lrp/AsnC family transcriptional regulator [Crocinitomicaceae bacterium]
MKPIDPIDVKMLDILQHEGTITNKALADRLNRSVAATQERRRRLAEEGYIDRVVAILNHKKINRSLIAFSHVLLKSHSAETLGEFETQVIKFNEVMECLQMTGAYDFILRIAVEDMEAYNIFLREKLARLPDISTVQSFFVLRASKSDTAFPL